MLQEGKEEGKIVAAGECGLDYDRLQFCDKATQQKWFAAQFALAQECQLPMFLHSRAAAEDFATILSQHLGSFTGASLKPLRVYLAAGAALLVPALQPRPPLTRRGACMLHVEPGYARRASRAHSQLHWQ